MSDNPLGKNVDYPQRYSPDLLVGIPRTINRHKLNIAEGSLPFYGADIWNAYELSWLNTKGKPVSGIGQFIFPCDSPNIVESKSLKLYLNSLNQECYESLDALRSVIQRDLSAITAKEADVHIMPLGGEEALILTPEGVCLDEIDISINTFEPSADLLSLDLSGQDNTKNVDEALYTNLFKSNCPITNQPDWATVTISYQGNKISHASLLEYLVSYRQHSDYHENCVEAIFQDIQQQCSPESLTVVANFLRRGGIDINPLRSSKENFMALSFPRFIRQ